MSTPIVPARGRRLFGTGVAALLALAALTAVVAANWSTVVDADTGAHQALMEYGQARPGWVGAMRLVTHVGDTTTLVLVDAALVGFCLVRRQPRLAGLVAGVAIATWAVRVAIRDLVARPRPAGAFWSEAQASFPSGHTTNTTVTVGLVLLVCWPLLGRVGRVLASGGAVVVAVAVGLSRLAGGVHWPSDVVGGWLLGAGTVAVVAGVRAMRRRRHRPPSED